MLFVQGCGLGWLYMKIGDSKRIAGLKVLSYSTALSRFETAQRSFKGAIEYYKDSILYDDASNPDVYPKLGLTYLMLVPADRYEDETLKGNARSAFISGLNILRRTMDAERSKRGLVPAMIRLEQEVRAELQITDDIEGAAQVPPVKPGEPAAEVDDSAADFFDEDYARLHAGLGQLTFLEAIQSRREKSYKVALFHYKLAERAGKKGRKPTGAAGFMDKVADVFNLSEIVDRVPYVVEVAKVHNYLALSFRKKGNAKLQAYHFALAKEALDSAKETYPNDARVYAESARLAFYQGEFQKALTDIQKVLKETEFYADKREFTLLQGQIYNEMGKADEALQSFEWILEREERSIEAKLGRARAFAQKKDRNSSQADVTAVLSEDDKNPHLFREAGEVYRVLGDRSAASDMYLKAYYLDKDNIEVVFELGMLYREQGKKQEAADCFQKVVALNPLSDFAVKANELLKQK